MDDALVDLFERNATHRESLPDGYFDAVQDGQAPDAVTVCCSDSRVLQDSLWGNDEPGHLFTVGNIGNRVGQRRDDGSTAVSGDVLYPLVHTGTETAVVVGHTGCGAVTAALAAYCDGLDEPPGIRHDVEALVPIVAAAHDDGVVDESTPDAEAVNRLVEVNVDAQIAFLRSAPDVPDDVAVYGMVYDFQGIYGEERGALQLVNANGETDLDALRELVPARFHDRVDRLTAP